MALEELDPVQQASPCKRRTPLPQRLSCIIPQCWDFKNIRISQGSKAGVLIHIHKKKDGLCRLSVEENDFRDGIIKVLLFRSFFFPMPPHPFSIFKNEINFAVCVCVFE